MDLREAVVLLVQGLLLACTLVVCSLRAGSKWRKWGKNFGVSTACRSLGDFWQWWFHAQPEDARVAMHMAERRLQRMRILAVTVMIASFFQGVLITFNIVAGKQRFYTVWMDIASSSAYVIVIVFNFWPALLSRMPNVLYSTLMAWVALNVSPAVESIDPLIANVWILVRICLSMAILDMRTIMFWNAVNSVAVWCQFVFILKHQQCAAVQVGEFTVAVKEISAYLLIIAICYMFKQGIAAEIREMLGASASRRECGAVSALLRGMSDVVVMLDSTLRVLGDCPTLAAMLLRESVRQTEFESFLYADDDQQQFHECIANAAVDQSEAIVAKRVRLRDAMGTCVVTEFFHTALEDVGGNMFHMIGIRELQSHAEADAETKSDLKSLPLPRRAPGATEATVAGNGGGGQRGIERPGRTEGPRDDDQPRDGSLADHGGQQTTGEERQWSSNQVADFDHVETASVSSSASGASRSSKASSSSRKSCKMMIEGLERTTAWAQRKSMARLLATWNVPVRSVGCCSYHALINEARNALKSLGRTRCNPFHVCSHEWQCIGCGILAPSPNDAKFNPFTRTCDSCRGAEDSPIGKIAL